MAASCRAVQHPEFCWADLAACAHHATLEVTGRAPRRRDLEVDGVAVA
jgi:hypothetical protein